MHRDRGRWCFLFNDHELVWDWARFAVDRDSYRFACLGSKTTHCTRCYHIVRSESRGADKSSPHGSGPRSASNTEGRAPWACPVEDWPRDRREVERVSPCLDERARIARFNRVESVESRVQESPGEGEGKKRKRRGKETDEADAATQLGSTRLPPRSL